MKLTEHVELRADERYALALPITMEGEDGQTLDLSAHGILFESAARPAVGARVSLVLTCQAGQVQWRIDCEGEVVRVEPLGQACNVAVRLREPLYR